MARRRSLTAYQFNKPLSTPESKVVYRCYASHGVGYGKCPPWGAKLRFLCVNRETREVKWCDGRYGRVSSNYECDEMRGNDEWARLGWVMADDSLLHGELDVVDPLLVQMGYMPKVDTRDIVTWL